MNAKDSTTQHTIALDAHPLVIGHATQVDTQTIAFDHHRLDPHGDGPCGAAR
ncbi:hypothetical protein NOV72_02111 [Caballeronia novacaledonica]|uniref:Uncharacterized protein n=1 Tax=Caballeronia novacaledonica TaxID=1544861 RepID=A0A2U3I436_9BURK|nr:hypothetical protein [Caballeronia novacaledonica]SPB14880.1 hypothetical protein NOV72_02111 [Caballeronia novacaledonica]